MEHSENKTVTKVYTYDYEEYEEQGKGPETMVNSRSIAPSCRQEIS